MTQDKELCFLWDNTIHGAIPAFEKFEAAFAFEKVFEHPYCPEEVDLKAYILKPNGDQTVSYTHLYNTRRVAS